MSCRFTPHATARIVECKVPGEWLQAVLEAPQRVLPGNYGRQIRQSVFERNGERWLSRVIVEGDLVLTVPLTSEVGKYGGAMKVEYDPQADAMYIRLMTGEVADSEEVKEGVVLDYDAAGRVLGIEMLDVSRRADNPREMAFELLTAR